MTWVPSRAGYFIECDRCGHLRGSNFKRDRTPVNRVGRRYVFIDQSRIPDHWQKIEEGEGHLCPQCACTVKKQNERPIVLITGGVPSGYLEEAIHERFMQFKREGLDGRNDNRNATVENTGDHQTDG